MIPQTQLPTLSRRMRSLGLPRLHMRPRHVIVLALLGLLAGCFNNPLPHLDRGVPAQWRNAPDVPARPPLDLHAWWKAFHDPLLDHLVDQALRNNPDVAIATEHLRAARALYGVRQSTLRPQLKIRTDNPIDPDASASYFVIGFDATWELGLFGRSQAVDRVAAGHLGEAVATLRGARVSLVAEVARDLVRLRTAQRREQLAKVILAAQQEQARLVRTRVHLKLADRNDLAQAEAALADARAALAEPRMQANEAAQQLALLLGRDEPDPSWLKPAPVPQLGPQGPIAAPAQLLRSRPGIAQAEARVIEAAGQLGIARADLYPRIGLGATTLWSTNIANYRHNQGTNEIGTAGPLISMPLFDWGLREAHKHAKGYLLKAAALAYRKAVLTGVAEVETDLGNLQQLRERELASIEACTSWQSAGHAQATRRRLGLASDLDGVAVSVGQAHAEQALASARSDRDMAFIALYKALGGAPPLPERDDSPATAATDAP